MTDWQDLVAWMRSPEVRAAVARYVPDEEQEPEQEEKTNEMPQVQATHFQI